MKLAFLLGGIVSLAFCFVMALNGHWGWGIAFMVMALLLAGDAEERGE